MKSRPSLGDCDRCFGTPRRATQSVRFVYKGIPYTTKLCDDHVAMIDRDMQSWTRTASEIGMELVGSSSAPDPERRARVIAPPTVRPARPTARPEPRRDEPFIVARGEVINHDAEPTLFPRPDEILPQTLEQWAESFTDHAVERMALRHVSKQDVWKTIQAPGKTRRCPAKAGGHPDTAKYTHAGIVVVVNERSHEIITVARVGDDLFSEAG